MPTTTTPNLYLVDGHAVVYKYYYAFAENPLTNSRGENTGPAFGLAKIICTLLNNYPVTHMGVLFDPSGGSFRKRIYPQYKDTRKHEDDVRPMILRAWQMCRAWGIFSNAYKSFEADDIIGTLARRHAAMGWRVWIVSKDKDFMQLLDDDRIKMIDLGSKIGKDEVTVIDAAAVEARFGVKPNQIRDLLALMGDTSDNVPGVQKVGKTGAAKFLQKYGDIDGIYENLDKREGKKALFTDVQKRNFNDAKPNMDLYRNLVTIKTDVEIVDADEATLIRPQKHTPELISLLQELEMPTILKEISDTPMSTPVT